MSTKTEVVKPKGNTKLGKMFNRMSQREGWVVTYCPAEAGSSEHIIVSTPAETIDISRRAFGIRAENKYSYVRALNVPQLFTINNYGSVASYLVKRFIWTEDNEIKEQDVKSTDQWSTIVANEVEDWIRNDYIVLFKQEIARHEEQVFARIRHLEQMAEAKLVPVPSQLAYAIERVERFVQRHEAKDINDIDIRYLTDHATNVLVYRMCKHFLQIAPEPHTGWTWFVDIDKDVYRRYTLGEAVAHTISDVSSNLYTSDMPLFGTAVKEFISLVR